MYVFVLSKTGKHLMPTHAAKARKLLKAKKARIASRNPFTIQLNYETTEYNQDLAAKLDPGFKKGAVALHSNDKITFQGEIIHWRYINQPTKGQVMVASTLTKYKNRTSNQKIIKMAAGRASKTLRHTSKPATKSASTAEPKLTKSRN